MNTLPESHSEIKELVGRLNEKLEDEYSNKVIAPMLKHKMKTLKKYGRRADYDVVTQAQHTSLTKQVMKTKIKQLFNAVGNNQQNLDSLLKSSVA